MKIYRSRVIDWMRKEKNTAEIRSLDEENAETLEGKMEGLSFSGPEEYGEFKEEAERLLGCLEKTGKAERDVICGRVLGDSSEETCRELHISPEAYRVRLHRARKYLLEAMEDFRDKK